VHSVDNLGPISSESVRVEFPALPDAAVSEVVRGAAPADLAHDLDKLEYTGPGLEIERVICEPGEVCSMQPTSGSSILIPITPCSVISASGATSTVRPGKVRGVLNGAPEKIAAPPGSTVAAHALRVIFTRT
jgi:hypothetical protein